MEDIEWDKLMEIAKEGTIFMEGDEFIPYNFGQYKAYSQKKFMAQDGKSEGVRSISYWLGDPYFDTIDELNQNTIYQKLEQFQKLAFQSGIMIEYVSANPIESYFRLQAILEKSFCGEEELQGLHIKV